MNQMNLMNLMNPEAQRPAPPPRGLPAPALPPAPAPAPYPAAGPTAAAVVMHGVAGSFRPAGQFGFVSAVSAGQVWTMTGDQVTVEMTPYDLTKGRIIYRGR